MSLLPTVLRPFFRHFFAMSDWHTPTTKTCRLNLVTTYFTVFIISPFCVIIQCDYYLLIKCNWMLTSGCSACKSGGGLGGVSCRRNRHVAVYLMALETTDIYKASSVKSHIITTSSTFNLVCCCQELLTLPFRAIWWMYLRQWKWCIEVCGQWRLPLERSLFSYVEGVQMSLEDQSTRAEVKWQKLWAVGVSVT